MTPLLPMGVCASTVEPERDIPAPPPSYPGGTTFIPRKPSVEPLYPRVGGHDGTTHTASTPENKYAIVEEDEPAAAAAPPAETADAAVPKLDLKGSGVGTDSADPAAARATQKKAAAVAGESRVGEGEEKKPDKAHKAHKTAPLPKKCHRCGETGHAGFECTRDSKKGPATDWRDAPLSYGQSLKNVGKDSSAAAAAEGGAALEGGAAQAKSADTTTRKGGMGKTSTPPPRKAQFASTSTVVKQAGAGAGAGNSESDSAAVKLQAMERGRATRTSSGKKKMSKMNHHDRLVAFFRRADKDKLGTIQGMLEEYAGKEAAMYAAISTQYPHYADALEGVEGAVIPAKGSVCRKCGSYEHKGFECRKASMMVKPLDWRDAPV